jgi:hypothetical protein
LLLAPPHANADGGAPTARAFMGVQSGVAVGLETGDRRGALELAQSFLPTPRLGSLTELALALGTRRHGGWLAGRVGYQLAILSYEDAPDRDVSHTGDLGLVLGWTAERGHEVALEAGVEAVRRGEDFRCCDSVADAFSVGARVVLAGELRLGRRAAIFGRLGLRTGDHLLELHLLPVLHAGVAFRF